jgi:hypothetical protein
MASRYKIPSAYRIGGTNFHSSWLKSGTANFVLFERDQAFLLPSDMKDWLPEDDLAHFVMAAAALEG